MSDLVKLSQPQMTIVQRLVGHWTERYSTSPEELAKTFYHPETGRTMDPQRLRDIMNGEGDVLSDEDIRIFTEVVCEELKQAEANEVEDYKWRADREPGLTRPRTVSDIVQELNAELAKG